MWMHLPQGAMAGKRKHSDMLGQESEGALEQRLTARCRNLLLDDAPALHDTTAANPPLCPPSLSLSVPQLNPTHAHEPHHHFDEAEGGIAMALIPQSALMPQSPSSPIVRISVAPGQATQAHLELSTLEPSHLQTISPARMCSREQAQMCHQAAPPQGAAGYSEASARNFTAPDWQSGDRSGRDTEVAHTSGALIAGVSADNESVAAGASIRRHANPYTLTEQATPFGDAVHHIASHHIASHHIASHHIASALADDALLHAVACHHGAARPYEPAPEFAPNATTRRQQHVGGEETKQVDTARHLADGGGAAGGVAGKAGEKEKDTATSTRVFAHSEGGMDMTSDPLASVPLEELPQAASCTLPVSPPLLSRALNASSSHTVIEATASEGRFHVVPGLQATYKTQVQQLDARGCRGQDAMALDVVTNVAAKGVHADAEVRARKQLSHNKCCLVM